MQRLALMHAAACANLRQSIDLTRMPSMHQPPSKVPGNEQAPHIEYSSREVSPAPLLLQQLVTANRIFLLHHAANLNDLFVKMPRDRFCSLLDRFWTRYCWNWDVLLHGNPSIEVFGGLKLAAGGELGFGVGEEEWGSGEREVLEGLVHDTEGLIDLTVSRFGDAAPPQDDSHVDHPSIETIQESASGLPWLGRGHLAQADDGIVFGGTGNIARSSLRDISAWVNQIYTHGEHAYGVKDAPQRARRQRRRREPHERQVSEADVEPTNLRKMAHRQNTKETNSTGKASDDMHALLPHDPRPAVHDRVASHDHATGSPGTQVASHPGIPPPIVTAAEDSLNQALSAAEGKPKPSTELEEAQTSTYGISSKWMKYLTLGLSEIGKGDPAPSARPSAPRRTSSSSSMTIRAPSSHTKDRKRREPDIQEDGDGPPMQDLDPTPDGSKVEAQLARQKLRESNGHFLIGLQGDLDTNESDGHLTDGTSSEEEGARNVLRTLHIEVPQDPPPQAEDDIQTLTSMTSVSIAEAQAPKYQRLRVLVYVQRPFIYTFLFESATPSLKLDSYYRTLHLHLRPLHKSMLNSTSTYQVAQRIATSLLPPPESTSVDATQFPFNDYHNSPVFDLVYDPLTYTLHTSLPNIPEPGTPAAEGLGTAIGTTSNGRTDPPPWTRIEALNVHSQILNTLMSVRDEKRELERTSKTSRGWWVVWMRIPPSKPSSISHHAHPDSLSGGSSNNASINQPQANPLEREERRTEACRIAFLVRKSSDMVKGRANVGSRVSSAMFGFGGGQTADEAQPGGVGWSASSLTGGIGIDARKYVEGLLSLNR